MVSHKKVLFIHDNLFLSPDANSRIVFRLIKHLIDYYNVEISLMGRATCVEEYADEYQGCKLIHESQIRFEKTRMLKQKLGKFHFLRYILMPRTIYYRIYNEEEPYVVEARKWLKKHASKYDVVIATCAPYYPLKLAAEISNKLPVVYYKIDPVATINLPSSLNKDNRLVTMENEIAWDKCASCIITTDVIFKLYNQLPTKVNANKVLQLNYPNIVERHLSDTNNDVVRGFDEMKINVCYIGKFYLVDRNPQFLLNLMKQLTDTDIVLHIIGPIGDCKMMINEYLSTSDSNVVYHGVVPPQVADDIMLQSDILLHVGNLIDSLMPSKILDYISSGKPILNICKIPSCPTLPLMERYPLGMTVYEYNELTEDIVENIIRFCNDNKGKQIPFNKIADLYYDSTIEYVGQRFYEVIESVIMK